LEDSRRQLAGHVPEGLIDLTKGIVVQWMQQWSDDNKKSDNKSNEDSAGNKRDNGMAHFFNKKRFIHEIEEALVCVAQLLRFFENTSSPWPSCVVYDVCAGKGFLSMLLAYLVPQIPCLSHITRVVMVLSKSKFFLLEKTKPNKKTN